MAELFVLTIRLHDRRFHGAGDWPPSPARAFQALVAGAARGRRLPGPIVSALEVLEGLSPPTIAAPAASRGSRVVLFVPNNDADSLGGNLDRIGEIRTEKVVEPWLLESDEPFVYAWALDRADASIRPLIEAASDLYQFGRGVDMAWAQGEILEEAILEVRLFAHRGTVHRPAPGQGKVELPCPARTSLRSLTTRFEESGRRLRAPADDAAPGRLLFAQAPKPFFVIAAYDSPPAERLYELQRSDGSSLLPWPVRRVVELVERIRDGASARLQEALPDRAADVERVLIGRKPGGPRAGSSEERIRIVPLPSIGHEHVDPAVRRVLVQVPSGGPLAPADVFWAMSGLETFDPATGELDPFVLVPTEDDTMRARYSRSTFRWRSVTPLALPESAGRRRIDPSRRRSEPKGSEERSAEERQAVLAIATALRHAGVCASLRHARVQREPFETRGTRAERFAPGSRFPKERLWHVDVTFDRPIAGPLVLGDGRFLGLGIMAPEAEPPGIFAFSIEGGISDRADPVAVARALRRAVMARVGSSGARVAPYFTGHAQDGLPARSEDEPHLAFHADLPERLLVIAPHLLEGRSAYRWELDHLAHLDAALEGLHELRAGAGGLLRLRRDPVALQSDRLLGSSRAWTSVTPYTVDRHRKGKSAQEAIIADVLEACARRGLPRPSVRVQGGIGVPGRGLEGSVELRFAVAVAGPLALGRTRHVGGGLFQPLVEGT